jgi:heme exporter protein D
MQWQSLSHFLDMGGYAFFVWGSYGVTLVVLAAEIWTLRRRRGAALEQVRTAALAASRRTA